DNPHMEYRHIAIGVSCYIDKNIVWAKQVPVAPWKIQILICYHINQATTRGDPKSEHKRYSDTNRNAIYLFFFLFYKKIAAEEIMQLSILDARIQVPLTKQLINITTEKKENLRQQQHDDGV
ncbi:hypothetical protein ACJX0J_028382, partial [Zea mays]